MDNLFTLILLGLVLFLMLRKNGMKCYGGHGRGGRGNHLFEDSRYMYTDDRKANERQPEIIDLSKDDYRVLPFDE